MLEGLSNANIGQTRTLIEQESVQTQRLADSLETATRYGTDEEIMDACKEFESYFLHYMLKQMGKTVGSENGLFGSSNASNIYQDMYYEEVAKSATNSGGIGLASFMYKQMVREREGTVTPNK